MFPIEARAASSEAFLGPQAPQSLYFVDATMEGGLHSLVECNRERHECTEQSCFRIRLLNTAQAVSSTRPVPIVKFTFQTVTEVPDCCERCAISTNPYRDWKNCQKPNSAILSGARFGSVGLWIQLTVGTRLRPSWR